MTLVAWIFVAVAAMIFQSKISLFGYPLNLSVVIVYAFGISQSIQQSASRSVSVSAEIKSVIFGAAVGILEDGMTGTVMGPNLLGKGFAGFVSSFIFRDVFFQWDSVLGGIVLCLLTVADGFIVIGARLIFSNAAVGGWAVSRLIVLQAIMNIPLGLLIRPGPKESAERIWFRRRRYN